jgi:hypothetical protein
MDTTTELAIAEAIKKNLPLEVGELLKKELAALAALRIRSAADMADVQSLRQKLADALTEVSARQKQLEAHAAITAREAAVTVREQTQALRDLQVAQAELRRADAFQLVSLVFRSPVFTTHVRGTVPVPVEGMGGQYPAPGMVQNAPFDKTTTVTEG